MALLDWFIFTTDVYCSGDVAKKTKHLSYLKTNAFSVVMGFLNVILAFFFFSGTYISSIKNVRESWSLGSKSYKNPCNHDQNYANYREIFVANLKTQDEMLFEISAP